MHDPKKAFDPLASLFDGPNLRALSQALDAGAPGQGMSDLFGVEPEAPLAPSADVVPPRPTWADLLPQAAPLGLDLPRDPAALVGAVGGVGALDTPSAEEDAPTERAPEALDAVSGASSEPLAAEGPTGAPAEGGGHAAAAPEAVVASVAAPVAAEPDKVALAKALAQAALARAQAARTAAPTAPAAAGATPEAPPAATPPAAAPGVDKVALAKALARAAMARSGGAAAGAPRSEPPSASAPPPAARPSAAKLAPPPAAPPAARASSLAERAARPRSALEAARLAAEAERAQKARAALEDAQLLAGRVGELLRRLLAGARHLEVANVLLLDERDTFRALWKGHRARFAHLGALDQVVSVTHVLRALDAVASGQLVVAILETESTDFLVFVDLGAQALIAAFPNARSWYAGLRR